MKHTYKEIERREYTKYIFYRGLMTIAIVYDYHDSKRKAEFKSNCLLTFDEIHWIKNVVGIKSLEKGR